MSWADVVAGGEHGEIVIGVVVVGAGFASEAHAGEGAELGGDIGFEEHVQVDKFVRDAESAHFEHLEDDGFSVLGLIECGVVIGGGSAMAGVNAGATVLSQAER